MDRSCSRDDLGRRKTEIVPSDPKVFPFAFKSLLSDEKNFLSLTIFMNTLKFASLQSETSFGDKSFSALAFSWRTIVTGAEIHWNEVPKATGKKTTFEKNFGWNHHNYNRCANAAAAASAASPPLSSRSSSRQVALWDWATGCDLWWKTMISITTATSSRAQKYFFLFAF